jgi:hypothetical protein
MRPSNAGLGAGIRESLGREGFCGHPFSAEASTTPQLSTKREVRECGEGDYVVVSDLGIRRCYGVFPLGLAAS